jgi:hypothetical protein
MKTLKAELTQEEDDGRRIVKTLEGADAQQWQQWVDSGCLLAWTHGRNPHWRVRELEPEQEPPPA